MASLALLSFLPALLAPAPTSLPLRAFPAATSRAAARAGRGGHGCAAPSEPWEGHAWEDRLTCVEYSMGGETRLGVYIKYSMVHAEPHIRPLCSPSEEEGVSALLQDEEAAVVPLHAVTKILDADYVYVSERQAGGGQGLGNPHGEHGEECYDLRDVELSEGVRVVVRDGRDTQRVL